MPVAFYAAWLQRSFTLPGTWTKSLCPQLLVTPSCPPEPCAKAVAPAKAGSQWSVVCVRSLRKLLNHFLKLLIDYRSIKTIDGDACLAVAHGSP